jgi:hypothetical protein
LRHTERTGPAAGSAGPAQGAAEEEQQQACSWSTS